MRARRLPDAVLTRYFAFRFTAWLVDYLLLFGVPLLCYKVTGNLAWSGIALALEWTPRILSLGGAGYLVDRLSIRRLCVVSDSARCALAGACALAIALWPGLAVAVTVGFSAVAGALFEQTFVAGEKAGKVLADPSDQARVQTILTGLEQVAVIGAPALGGMLLLFRPAVFPAAACALYGVSLLFSFALPPVRAEGSEPASLAAGLRTTAKDPVLRPIILLTMGLNYMLGLINGSAAQIAAERYGASTSVLSFIYSAASVASIAVLGLSPWLIRRFGLWRFGAGTAVLSPVLCLLLGVAPTLIGFGVCLGLFLALDSLFSVYMRTSRAERVPEAVYGSTVAAFGLLVIVPLPLAGLTLALLGHHANLRPVLIGAALGSLILAAVLIPVLARAGNGNPRAADTPGRAEVLVDTFGTGELNT